VEHYLGQVQLFPQRAPLGWAVCDGQQLSVKDNPNLYSVLGTAFGGNGTSTFALPDLQGKEPLDGLRYCIALTGKLPWPSGFSPQKT
jgi:microcystin-dependent protein